MLNAVLFIVCVFVFFLVKDLLGIGRCANAPPLIRGWIPYVGCYWDLWEDPTGFLEQARNRHGEF
jgi:hypothetical protein